MYDREHWVEIERPQDFKSIRLPRRVGVGMSSWGRRASCGDSLWCCVLPLRRLSQYIRCVFYGFQLTA